ncbi:MAG: acetyl-CoA carboxylase biotin carboxylase subunit [Actinomycetales bacterium]|nr:acetyl-CoA carboxylase biotin carboxylase subunit [Tetrasphaera sp.]NLW98439.1 acetyl-CoA carboxylase biotin carboxylase subunit [Actinomycetales bacterium]
MRRLLIANRGEIATRIIRAAREFGIESVAVCSEADVGALHVRMADAHVVVGPAPAAKSYLNTEALLAAAAQVEADAVHPGYGFLAENARFAQAVIDAGLTWVGPTPDAISLMGDKLGARATAQAAGVRTVPGTVDPLPDAAAAVEAAKDIGFPVALKASAGGGGRGIRVVTTPEELAAQYPVAQAEAQAAFGDGTVYLERLVEPAQHIEVQVFGDGESVIHLGERACSMQRRRQKVIEEAPAPGLPDQVRAAMCEAAVALAQQVHYRGAGTVEFLYDPQSQEFFFLEMNTRIQVEHPVTEMVYGVDLVREQLQVARGEPLSISQEEVDPRGHAIEVRLTAENPAFNFLPSPGVLTRFRMPGGPFVRVDSGFEEGSQISPYYDSLVAKIITWGRNRDIARTRMIRALEEADIGGIETTAQFLRDLVDVPEFRSGEYHTMFLEQYLARPESATAQ